MLAATTAAMPSMQGISSVHTHSQGLSSTNRQSINRQPERIITAQHYKKQFDASVYSFFDVFFGRHFRHFYWLVRFGLVFPPGSLFCHNWSWILSLHQLLPRSFPLARLIRFPVSSNTLRRIRTRLPLPSSPPPRSVGLSTLILCCVPLQSL